MMPYLLAHAAGLAARLSDGLLDELDEGAGRYQVRRARVNGHGPRTPVISTHHELAHKLLEIGPGVGQSGDVLQ